MPRKHKDESGQSTIEFALTMVLLIAFILFFLQLTLVFGVGNYFHYATFMSARAYLAAGSTPDDQRERANSVAIRMLKKSESQAGADRFPSIAQGMGEGDVKGLTVQAADPANLDSSWMQGVRYKFRSRLFLMPLAGKTGKGQSSLNQLILTSESWLGREPSYQDCQNEMEKMKGLFDNGC
ncbi:TadE family protein [Bdellovibrionota bacterium FG-2]